MWDFHVPNANLTRNLEGVYDAGMKLYATFPKNMEFLNDGINSIYLSQHYKVISLSPTL